ncbi:hypothetical protein IAQ61_001340 [Plenodomus lingam]|uniref:MARVEL domain-containing protein n=1 Tax=Leptosphaeria maculans (strain JN3 / isolate v23.1.3 / race Av1-4-5-6-7-8) TaxID=985895 RepID=E4ZXS0_LEPMJ|nr:hypothetical protein LEMA_P110840.1 [Plenodomus lingam JN3]KAH9879522.1 hypothetical protein IAQ61_001340 [Plenodomus lingam]CBX96165.1 hypothetical protein LEMA_P110840.1 [Plenodomus lingam JN3]
MALRKGRVKPAQYPTIAFHGIRCAQLVSSAVVASIMLYFCSELARDEYQLPWTFLLLFSVSLLTIIALVATIAMHCFYGLNPVLNIALNSLLAILWALAFALLAWWSSGTLAHVCNVENWESDMGIAVCRLYKALFSFTLFGLLSTLLALVLDVRVQRSATERGRFQQLDALGSVGKIDDQGPEHPGRHGIAGAPGIQRQQNSQERNGHRYSLPEEQFAYDDSLAYVGSAGQIGRRSLDERI